VEGMMSIITSFKKLNIEYAGSWDYVSTEEVEHSFDFVMTNISLEACTLSQAAQAVPLIFDVGFKGEFSESYHDFYGGMRSHLERTLLDKLLKEFTKDGRKLVIDTLKIIDAHYGSE
jgi:hypothetical protein